MYEEAKYSSYESVVFGLAEKDEYSLGDWKPSNEFVTWRVIKEYPNIGLNNTVQHFYDFDLYPYNEFDAGKVLGSEHSRHMNTNLWRNNGVDEVKLKLKMTYPVKKVLAIKTIFSRKKEQKHTTFYKYIHNNTEISRK